MILHMSQIIKDLFKRPLISFCHMFYFGEELIFVFLLETTYWNLYACK